MILNLPGDNELTFSTSTHRNMIMTYTFATVIYIR